MQEQQLLLELRDRALDFMNEGIWIADTGGSLLYANQGFSSISGYPVHEIVGQTWSFNKVRARALNPGPSPAACRAQSVGILSNQSTHVTILKRDVNKTRIAFVYKCVCLFVFACACATVPRAS